MSPREELYGEKFYASLPTVESADSLVSQLAMKEDADGEDEIAVHDSALGSVQGVPITVRATTVRFGSVQVREYIRIVGDHPDVRVGPPISIGWQFSEKKPLPLHEYEAARPNKRKNLRLSSITRKNMLRNVFKVPEEEIRAAEKEVQRIHKQRESTAARSGTTTEKVEVAVQSARRKVRRVLSRKAVLRSLAAASTAMMPMGMAY